MQYEEYRKANFPEPQPLSRYSFSGMGGITLFFKNYEEAVAYYEAVLGAPNYVEGEGTRGWQIGEHWLTLLAGNDGSPTNVEVMFSMQTEQDAERLHKAFIEAGGVGQDPVDGLMYAPVRL